LPKQKKEKEMKKTLTLAAAALISASAFAQTVTSANIVGYVKNEGPTGFHIAGMQFDNPTNSLSTVFGDTLPKGSQVYTFDSGYTIAEYDDVFVPITGLVTKWQPDTVLTSGEGFWIELASPVTNIFSGDVPMNDVITNSIVEGFQLCVYPYPVDRVITNLGFSPSKGDRIYTYDGGYSIAEYGDVFVPIVGLVTKWAPETTAISAGQGFWYETTNATDWVVERPFDAE
jgi:hypothetical protein